MNYQRFIIGGRLVRDPALKYLPSGMAVAEFGIACSNKYKTKDGEQREDTLFIDAAAFGTTGENINKYFKKGDPIFCEGKLKLETWEDKQGGGKRSKIKMVVDQFQFVAGKKDGGGEQAPAGTTRKSPGDEKFGDEDIPF